PKTQIPKPKSQDPNPKPESQTQIPRPKSQDPNPNPKSNRILEIKISRLTIEAGMKTATPGRGSSTERRGSFTTISGRPINELYTPADIASLDYARDLGNPGDFPYTRGIHTNGYHGKLWTMRQFAGFGTPEETNQRYKQLLKAGGTGLIGARYLPTPTR